MSREPVTHIVDVPNTETPWRDLTSQHTRNEAVICLLEEWMTDESGYDEEVWPIVRQTIEEHRSSYRRRFDD